MEPLRHDSGTRLAGTSWPPPRDHGAAALRLEICRHLLGHLAEDRLARGAADFTQVSAFLSRWTEDRVRRDLGEFCAEAVRVLGQLLDHVEPGTLPPPVPPCAVALD